MNQRFAERFEAGLQKMIEGLAKPRGEKRMEKLSERLGRLKAQCRGAGQHYAIELVPDATGQKATALHFEKQPIPGSRLTHLEAVFRSLKSELGLRPVFHHQETRVDGHLFITVLAYQFVQIIRRHLKEQGIAGRWDTLREILGSQCRVTATFRRADGRILHVRKATRPEPEALAIYQALNLNPAPGGIVKMIV
jgi:hypothetical protein